MFRQATALPGVPTDHTTVFRHTTALTFHTTVFRQTTALTFHTTVFRYTASISTEGVMAAPATEGPSPISTEGVMEIVQGRWQFSGEFVVVEADQVGNV